MISGKIHRLSGTDEINDMRSSCKFMANVISVKKLPSPPPWGRFPFKKVNYQVRMGDPTLYDLIKWYKWALLLTRHHAKD